MSDEQDRKRSDRALVAVIALLAAVAFALCDLMYGAGVAYQRKYHHAPEWWAWLPYEVFIVVLVLVCGLWWAAREK